MVGWGQVSLPVCVMCDMCMCCVRVEHLGFMVEGSLCGVSGASPFLCGCLSRTYLSLPQADPFCLQAAVCPRVALLARSLLPCGSGQVTGVVKEEFGLFVSSM